MWFEGMAWIVLTEVAFQLKDRYSMKSPSLEGMEENSWERHFLNWVVIHKSSLWRQREQEVRSQRVEVQTGGHSCVGLVWLTVPKGEDQEMHFIYRCLSFGQIWSENEEIRGFSNKDK